MLYDVIYGKRIHVEVRTELYKPSVVTEDL